MELPRLVRKRLEQKLRELDIVVQEGRHAAVAMVLKEDSKSNDVHLLLMKRAEREGDPWSGQISLPGGHKDPSDEDLLATAIRENHEEVGVALKEVSDHLGRLQSVDVKPKRPKGPQHVHPFVFVLNQDVEFALNHEAQKVFWLSLKEVQSGRLDGTHSFQYAGRDMQLPCWNAQGEVVWGLTYKIVTRLLNLVSRISF